MKKLTQAIQKLEKLFNGKLVQKGSGGNYKASKGADYCTRHIELSPQYKITFDINYFKKTDNVHVDYRLTTNYPKRLSDPNLKGSSAAGLESEWTPELFKIEDGKVISLFTDYMEAQNADLVKLAVFIKRKSSVLEVDLKNAKKLCRDVMTALAMLCMTLGLPRYIVTREDREQAGGKL